MEILVLGTGCAKCSTLQTHAEQAVREMGIEADVRKVSDLKEIMKFRVMVTPGLVVNGQVKAAGKVPSVEEIKRFLAE